MWFCITCFTCVTIFIYGIFYRIPFWNIFWIAFLCIPWCITNMLASPSSDNGNESLRGKHLASLISWNWVCWTCTRVCGHTNVGGYDNYIVGDLWWIFWTGCMNQYTTEEVPLRMCAQLSNWVISFTPYINKWFVRDSMIKTSRAGQDVLPPVI